MPASARHPIPSSNASDAIPGRRGARRGRCDPSPGRVARCNQGPSNYVQPVAHVGPVPQVAPVGQVAMVGALQTIVLVGMVQPVVLVQAVQQLQPVQELEDFQLLRRVLAKFETAIRSPWWLDGTKTQPQWRDQ
eukprot:gene15127-biopygen6658